MPQILCPECQTPNDPHASGWAYCTKCGKRLVIRPDDGHLFGSQRTEQHKASPVRTGSTAAPANRRTSYKAFYITAVIVALINLTNLTSRFNVLPPGVPVLMTGIAIAYCLLMPRISLLTASLVWIGLSVLIGFLSPAAEAVGSAGFKFVVGISGMLAYSLIAPMLFGLTVHGISLLFRTRGRDAQSAADSAPVVQPPGSSEKPRGAS